MAQGAAKWQRIRVNLELERGIMQFNEEHNYIECLFCCTRIRTIDKWVVWRHLRSMIHVENARPRAAGRPRPSRSSYDACSSRQSGFFMELAEFFIRCDISFEKLEIPEARFFLSKWTRQVIPSPSTMRNGYVDVLFTSTIQRIREEVGANPIRFGIDETTDVDKRKVTNFLVKPLSRLGGGVPRLLDCQVLQEVNGATIAQFAINCLRVLWPDNIPVERVLLFGSDGAAYMGVAASRLKEHFPKLIHVTCAVHGLHRVAEAVKEHYSICNDIIANTKSVFLKAQARADVFKRMYPDMPLPPEPILTRWGTWLKAASYYSKHFHQIKDVVNALVPDSVAVRQAKESYVDGTSHENFKYIDQNFSLIFRVITQLEERFIFLYDALDLMDEVVIGLEALENCPQSITAKLNLIINKNKGLAMLMKADQCIATKSRVVPANFASLGWSMDDIQLMESAPITTCDVERTFSMYNAVLR